MAGFSSDTAVSTLTLNSLNLQTYWNRVLLCSPGLPRTQSSCLAYLSPGITGMCCHIWLCMVNPFLCFAFICAYKVWVFKSMLLGLNFFYVCKMGVTVIHFLWRTVKQCPAVTCTLYYYYNLKGISLEGGTHLYHYTLDIRQEDLELSSRLVWLDSKTLSQNNNKKIHLSWKLYLPITHFPTCS